MFGQVREALNKSQKATCHFEGAPKARSEKSLLDRPAGRMKREISPLASLRRNDISLLLPSLCLRLVQRFLREGGRPE